MANTQFQLTGNAAELYEKYVVPTSASPAARGMLDRIELNASDRILDAACGPGVVTRLLAERGLKVAGVVGLDLNESMLDVARKLEPDASFPITWQQGDLCAMPFSDAEFDVVLCNHGFQFVPDKALALAEIKRVLTNDGRFVFTVWSAAPPMPVAIADSIRTHIGEDVAKAVLSPFSFRDVPTIRKLLQDAGFQSIAVQELTITRRLPATEKTAMDIIERSPYAGDVAAAGDTERDAIVREVFDAMQPYKQGSEFVEPMSNHLVQVQKVQ